MLTASGPTIQQRSAHILLLLNLTTAVILLYSFSLLVRVSGDRCYVAMKTANASMNRRQCGIMGVAGFIVIHTLAVTHREMFVDKQDLEVSDMFDCAVCVPTFPLTCVSSQMN